jgi:hypothetical protein
MMTRFRLGERAVRDAMELGRAVAALDQVLGDPADHVVVLGVHHHQRALALGDAQDVEQLVVLQSPLRIGHVDLERGDAASDRGRQLVGQHLLRGIADDQVEAVVDDSLGACALVIIGDGSGDRRAAVLGGERNDRRRAAIRRGHGAAIEVVRRHDPHAGELLDVAVAVDAAGQHVPAPGVDIARAGGQPLGDRDDLLSGDADVGTHRLGGGRHRAVTDGEVELIHAIRILFVARVERVAQAVAQ